MKRRAKRAVSMLLLLAVSGSFFVAGAIPEEKQTEESSAAGSLLSYNEYKKAGGTGEFGEKIVIPASEAVPGSDAVKYSENFGGSGEGGVLIPSDCSARWSFDAPADASYIMTVRYMPGETGSGDVEAELLLNGEIPFRQVSLVGFKRTYEQSDVFETNIAGNEVKPEVTEILVWRDYALRDPSGYITEPFVFFVPGGAGSIELSVSRGSLCVASVTLSAYSPPVSYEDYLNKYKNGSSAENAEPVVIEGEKFTYKNSLTVLPAVDRSTPGTFPQSASVLKLNTVGGNNWKRIGDSLTWKFTIDEPGFYEIAPRFRQNILDGIFTTRELKIDGNAPFAEAAVLRFNYSNDWQIKKLGNDEGAFRFYFDAGEHSLTLEAAAGDVAEMIGQVEASINTLNKIYRKIIMITGVSPDQYRDYNFKNLIPDEIKGLAEQKKLLEDAAGLIDKEAGGNGSYTSIIKKIIFQLKMMSENPKLIAKHLEQFKANMGALSSWLLTATEQPLQLDRFYIMPAGSSLPKADAGFFKKLLFGAECFISSFMTDYSSVGQSSETDYSGALKVWVQTGRDQAEIIRQLIDTQFAGQNNAQVTLELVAAGTLLQSVLAGRSPDVAMDNGVSEPVNYAMRNANADLMQFDDFDDVAGRFHEAALTPYTYNGKVYALPQTFSFYMFFYRKDIFAEYNLKVPKTWEDLISIIPTFQRNSLGVGMPHDLNSYSMFLFQNKGDLYKNGGERTNLDSNTAINTFVELTELFVLYDLPYTFDFANRFRSGEMPCAVQDYSMYNQLTVFAPEIKGLWEMIPVPGKTQADGGIKNTSVGTGTNMMLLNSCADKALAWKFMKWYMQADVQSRYAMEMESVLGPAAKVATANVEALTKMSWSSSEYGNMLKQLDDVRGIPEVPGGYYLPRVLTFAFNRVYNTTTATQTTAENPVEVLAEYINELNFELTRKREEFSGAK